ncbi:MAG: hypothetical protein DIU60_016050, partial [Actinomycetes bacterium]
MRRIAELVVPDGTAAARRTSGAVGGVDEIRGRRSSSGTRAEIGCAEEDPGGVGITMGVWLMRRPASAVSPPRAWPPRPCCRTS